MTFQEELQRELDETLPRETLDRLTRLDARLESWSEAIRLVGFSNRRERLCRYFAEALRALPWLPRKGSVLDVGSGGGSPALPLAVARPALAWTLLDSNRRKCVFLEEMARELSLSGVAVRNARFEDLEGQAERDAVTVRGLELGGDLWRRLLASVAVDGAVLWFSSRRRLEEGAEEMLAGHWPVRVGGPHSLSSPGCSGGWLLVVERLGDVSRETLPRKS